MSLLQKSFERSNPTFRSISAVCAFILIGGVLLWDLIAMIFAPNDTISNVISHWNPKTGGLLALVALAMYVHWFLPLPSCWINPPS